MRFQTSHALALLSAGLLAAVQAAPVEFEVTARETEITAGEIATKAAEGLYLLSLGEDETPVWKTEEEKLELMRAKVNFMDVTEVWEVKQALKAEGKKTAAKKVTYAAPSHSSTVTPLLAKVSTSNMQSDLSTLTAFNNRYYRSTTGGEASDWIRSTVTSIASGRSDITVSKFTHSWTQSSTILKFAGTNTGGAITILGAHMDSINLNSPTSGRAPGADDDGTGTVNLIEVVRVLVNAGYKPSTPLEFHWYSGEESGLLGSQAVAANYASAGKSVKAFMELDMTGYFKSGTTEVMALQADYIDKGLNTFLGQVINLYSRFGWTMDIACGYACSDHASWYDYGYPTSFPYEAVTGNDDPYIHSSSDTTSVSGFSWAHSLEFAKVGVAFAVELTV